MSEPSETFNLIEKFVESLTPMVANETHAWNLWNYIASDNGDIRRALEHVWAKRDAFDSAGEKTSQNERGPATVNELIEKTGLSTKQISRLFGVSEREVQGWIKTEIVPDKNDTRLKDLISRIMPLGQTEKERYGKLFRSSEGPSLFHQMVEEIPVAAVLQSSSLSVRDRLNVETS